MNMTDHNQTRKYLSGSRLVLLFIAALAVRIVYFYMASPDPLRLRLDAADYDAYAQHLVQGVTYENSNGDRATRMPGYPLFLAGIKACAGQSILAVVCAQIFLSALSVVLLALSAKKVMPDFWALVAGVIAVGYYDLFTGCVSVLSETLFIFVISLFFAVVVHASTPRARFAVFSGLLAGVAMLIRAEIGLFIMVGGLLWIRIPYRRGLCMALLFWISAAVVLCPWVLRNRMLFHRWVPTTSTLKYNQYIGLRFGQEKLGLQSGERFAARTVPEPERNALYGQAVSDLYRRTPLKVMVQVFLYNLAVLFYPFHPAFDWTFIFCLPFWLYALTRSFKDPSERWPLWLALYLGAMASSYVVFGSTVARYRETLAPAVVLLSAYGLYELRKKLKLKSYSTIMTSWAICVFMFWMFAPHVRLFMLSLRDRWW
jgi:hypothetical protein